MFRRGKCEKDFNEQGPKGQNMILSRPEGQMEGQQGQWQSIGAGTGGTHPTLAEHPGSADFCADRGGGNPRPR